MRALQLATYMNDLDVGGMITKSVDNMKTDGEIDYIEGSYKP